MVLNAMVILQILVLSHVTHMLILLYKIMVFALVIMIGIMLSNMDLHHAVLMEGQGVTMSIKIMTLLVSKGMDI
jgi:hypothetical protein